MEMKRPALIAGNWKMNLNHLQAIAVVQKLAWVLNEAKHDNGRTEVAVFPPFTDLRSVQTLIDADKLHVKLGAQDLSEHDSGAFTGDISGAFLAALDVKMVIVGHSERRTGHHEDDTVVNAKVRAALRHGLVPVICVGETAEDLAEHGASAIPVQQLRAALQGVSSGSNIVVAYEPVWAIGSGTAATPADAQTVCAALRETVREVLGDATAESSRILYGGSVNSGNIATFMQQSDIDGALVGGASLDPEEFAKIARFESHVVVNRSL